MEPYYFATEDDMQKWLSERLSEDECFSSLITNADEYYEMQKSDSIEFNKVLDSYKSCLKSLNMVEVISQNQNISLKSGDVLRPDFLLYAIETQSIVIVELKNDANPSRQVGTEISAYSSEVKSYIPFISDGDIINIIISPIWTTLIKHYIVHEIFWMQRNILCLQPTKINDTIVLEIKDIESIIDVEHTFKLSDRHLGGYHVCLYDNQLYTKSHDRTRLDTYLEQVKTSMHAMSSKGSAQKNHGFAILWKDNYVSLASYFITVVNFAPFQSIERLFHDPKFVPNEITQKFVDIICESDPSGHSNSLDEIFNNGRVFLENFCNPHREGFFQWDRLKHPFEENRANPISFQAWGIFSELYFEKMHSEYKKGRNDIGYSDPTIGLQLINEIIDPNYHFIDMSASKEGFEDEIEEDEIEDENGESLDYNMDTDGLPF